MIYTPTIKQVEEDIVLCYYDSPMPKPEDYKTIMNENTNYQHHYNVWQSSQKTVKFHPDHKEEVKGLLHVEIYPALNLDIKLKQGIPADAIKERIDFENGFAVLKPLPLPIEEQPYQKLFNHMHDQHGLILLQTEMQEIIDIVKSDNRPIEESQEELWMKIINDSQWFDMKNTSKQTLQYFMDKYLITRIKK